MKDELGKSFLGDAWLKMAVRTVVKNLRLGVRQSSFCILDLSYISKAVELVTQSHQTLGSPSLKFGQFACTKLSSVPDTKQIHNNSTFNFLLYFGGRQLMHL